MEDDVLIVDALKMFTRDEARVIYYTAFRDELVLYLRRPSKKAYLKLREVAELMILKYQLDRDFFERPLQKERVLVWPAMDA